MTFEEFIGGDVGSVDWQEAKRRLLAHLDACPAGREHQDCPEAVRIISGLARASRGLESKRAALVRKPTRRNPKQLARDGNGSFWSRNQQPVIEWAQECASDDCTSAKIAESTEAEINDGHLHGDAGS